MVRLRSPAPVIFGGGTAADIIKFHMGAFPSGQRGQTVNLLAMPSVVRIHHPPPSVANKIDATRKPLESLAVFAFSRQVFSFDFHRCHIDTRWIRTTEVSFRGLISLIFQRSQPSFFVFGNISQEIYYTNIKTLCCVVWQHISRR